MNGKNHFLLLLSMSVSVLTADTFKDRIWLFATPLESQGTAINWSTLGLPQSATTTQPEVAANYLGINNVMVVEHVPRLLPSGFQSYYTSRNLSQFSKVSWFLSGPFNNPVTPPALQPETITLAASNPNITDFILDDLFGGDLDSTPRFTEQQLKDWHSKTFTDLPARTHRNLSVVIYDHDINHATESNWNSKYVDRLKQCDVITVWFDYQKNLYNDRYLNLQPPSKTLINDRYIEATILRLENRMSDWTHKPKIVLGCYMWQLLGAVSQTGNIGLFEMETFLEFARVNILGSRIHGIIFLGSPFVLSTEASATVGFVKNWIAANKNTEIPSTSLWPPAAAMTGNKIWSSPVVYEISETEQGSPIQTITTPVVVVASYDGWIYAFDRRYGKSLWSQNVGGQIYSTPLVTPDGQIYFGTLNGWVYRINGITGDKLNEYNAGAPIYSSPALKWDSQNPANSCIYIGTHNSDAKLRAFNLNLSLKWTTPFAAGAVYASPAVAANGTIYCPTLDGKMYAVLDTGSAGVAKWTSPFQITGALHGSPAIGNNGKVYTASTSGTVYEITDNGQGTVPTSRSYSIGANVESSPVISEDGSVYIGAENGKLYSLNFSITTPSKMWEFPTVSGIGAVKSIPTITADGTILYTGYALHGSCERGTLFSLHSNGTLRWKFPISIGQGLPQYSSPVVDLSGNIFVGSSDNQLYAIKGDRIGMKTSWSSFKKNPERTSR